MSAISKTRLGAELEARGFAAGFTDPGYEAFLDRCETLGRVVAEETIALRQGAHAYVAQPGPVPLHTDHPEVDLVGWWCEAQDELDGACMLVDTKPLIEGLTEAERRVLRRVELECPPRAGGPPTLRFPVLRQKDGGDRLFCSPWLRSATPDPELVAALERFRVALSDFVKTEHRRVRLVPGQGLLVDNGRVMHGRGAIGIESPRRLRRVWIERRERA